MIVPTKHPGSLAVIEPAEWRWVFVASSLLALLVVLPFLFAYTAAGPSYRFMGVLVNPIDGMSYLAKMYEGYSGSWLFHLPYTPEPHRGVVLFTFYLALGHVTRLLGLPIILIFHAARLIGSLLMFVTIYVFIADCTGDVTQRRVTWGLAVVAGGFGWLALLFGKVTPDLLVLPEAFPLQAAYANAHFSWAIAAVVWIAHMLISTAVFDGAQWPRLDIHTSSLVAATIMAASIAPFVLAPISVGYAVLCGVLWLRRRALPRREMAWGTVVLIFGLPIIAYGFWAVSADNPIFEQWMRQNLTLSPAIWEYLAAFGPLIILAAIGLWGVRRTLQHEYLFLMGWIASTALLLYAPIGLQRRFAIGITVPLAIFAGIALWRVILPRIAGRWHTMLLIIVLSLTAPTTVMALALPLVGARHPAEAYYYYLKPSEIDALDWLQAHANPPDAVVLASPQIGLFLPTRGLHVVYGHPFETIRADERLKEVTDFYTGADCSVIAKEKVGYIIYGPRERALANDNTHCPLPSEKVFISADGQVAIYVAAGG